MVGETAPTGDDSLSLFMDLLREKKVSAFSTWEKELPRIADDPRYTGEPTLSHFGSSGSSCLHFLLPSFCQNNNPKKP